MSHIVDGRTIAQKIIKDLKKQPQPTQMLAVFLVGNDSSSLSFIKKKESVARELGVPFRLYQHDEEVPHEAVLHAFRKLDHDITVGGIVLQLPLPPQYRREEFLNILSPEKDIDNLTRKSSVLEPVVLATQAVLDYMKTDISHMTVAVIGKGFLVGAPIMRWITSRCRKLIPLDQRSGLKNIHEADIVISGAGRAKLITREHLKKGARVIDFGYDLDEGGAVSGDFDTNAADIVEWYTPTPGGTGPILVAQLFENFYRLIRHDN